jgi:hypothetical protein
MKPEDAWLAAKGQLQLQLHRATFETWVRDAQFESFEDGTLTAAVRNDYVKKWLEHRLVRPINQTLSAMLKQPVQVVFEVRDRPEWRYPFSPADWGEPNPPPSKPKPLPRPVPSPPKPAASVATAPEPSPDTGLHQLPAGIICLKQSAIPDPDKLSGTQAKAYLNMLRLVLPDGTLTANAREVNPRGGWAELEQMDERKIIQLHPDPTNRQRRKIRIIAISQPATTSKNHNSARITPLFEGKKSHSCENSETSNQDSNRIDSDSIDESKESIPEKIALLRRELDFNPKGLDTSRLDAFSMSELRSLVAHCRRMARKPTALAFKMISEGQKVQMTAEVRA